MSLKKRTAAKEQVSTALRLNKAMARAGICSRRKADQLIAAGKVRLNAGVVSELGTKVRPGDTIEVDGRSYTVRGDCQEHVYVALHKPVGVVTTASDPQGRPTVLDLLGPDLVRQRVVPVGRLDAMSEGLLLLTTDGDLTYRLTHPKWHVPKVYHVLVREEVDATRLKTMHQGMTLAEGEKLAPVKVKVVRASSEETLLEMELIQGINRQIRRMCRDLGLTIKWLKRVRQGKVVLDNLAPGKWRRLTDKEVASLKKDVGLESKTSG